MSFIFRLKGPSTGDVWKPVNSDPSDNTWKWDTNSEDAGNYQISVSVRDETHAGPQFTPDEKIVDFTLTAPPVPAEVQVQPTVEPLPVVTAPEQTYVPPVQSSSLLRCNRWRATGSNPCQFGSSHDQLDIGSASPQEAGLS